MRTTCGPMRQDHFRIECADWSGGPWHVIETLHSPKIVPVLNRAMRYRGKGAMGSVHIRVVRNDNVEEATIMGPRWEPVYW